MATKKQQKPEVETPVDTSQFRRVHKDDLNQKKGLTEGTKKLLIRVIAVAVAAGIICGVALGMNSKKKSYTAKVTDASSSIASGDITFTKQDYYAYLMEQFGASEVVDQALSAIAEKEVTDKKAINKIVKESEDEYKTYYKTLAKAAETLGYDSEKDLRNKKLIPDARMTLLTEQYLKAHYEDITKEYQVAYLKYISYEKESQALKAIKKATSEEEFTKLFKKAADNATDAAYVDKEASSLDANLLKKLATFSAVTKDGVYSEAVELSDGKFAAVYIYNTDKTKNQDTILEELSAESAVITQAKAAYLKQYGFKVYDDKLKDEIKNIDKTYIND